MGWDETRQYPNPSQVLKKFSNLSQTPLIKIQTRPFMGGATPKKSVSLSSLHFLSINKNL